MVSFSWPYVFLLLPLPWIYTLVTRNQDKVPGMRVSNQLGRALDKANTSSESRISWRLILRWLMWLSLIVAIAQPTIKSDSKILPATGRAVAIAVDLSASMERKDFSNNGESVNRLDVVKTIAGDFIENRAGDRIALVLFGKEAFIASPTTYDVLSVRHELERSTIGLAGRTTAIGDAIGLSIKALEADPAQDKAIVLLSDGTNNSGSVEPEVASELASELGIRIYTIGLGGTDSQASGDSVAGFTLNNGSADLDEETLKAIAQASSGQFFRARTTDELKEVYRTIDQLESAEEKAPAVILNRDLRDVAIAIHVLSALIYLLLTVGLSGRAFGLLRFGGLDRNLRRSQQ